MRIGCFADAHIEAGDPPEKDKRMRETLELLLDRATLVVSAGDFLEMYKRRGGRRRHFKKIMKAYPLTFEFLYLNWWRVAFINGNHDDGCLWMIPRVSPLNYYNLDGYQFFHGHQADIHFAHRTMEKISERIIKAVFRVEAWLSWMTKFKVSEWFADRQNRSLAGMEDLAEYGRKTLAQGTGWLDGVVAGHTHIRDFRRYTNGQSYLNIGTYRAGDVFILDTDTGNMERVANG
jgi:UDP-2,3-diacylglucosamine pyrophosphatase LpxH